LEELQDIADIAVIARHRRHPQPVQHRAVRGPRPRKAKSFTADLRGWTPIRGIRDVVIYSPKAISEIRAAPVQMLQAVPPGLKPVLLQPVTRA